MYIFWQSWNSFILCLLHHKLCLRLLFYFVFNQKSFFKIQIQAMDLDCDTIFVIVYNFPISLYHWYSTRYRLFSGGFLNKTWKKEEVIWQVPARRCLDYLSEWAWRASESTHFLHMLLSSSADMPDCQLGCKSMKWTQVLTMTEKEQKVQISAGNRGFPEKINSLSILTTITKLFCKWVTFAWECNFNNPLNSIKTAIPGPLPKWPKWPMCYEMKDDQNSIWRWIAQAVPGISWVWVGRGTPAKFKPSFQAARLRTSVKKLSNFLFWNLLSDWCSCGWECLQRGRTACQPQSVCCVEKERKRWQVLRCIWKSGTGSPPVTSP